MRDYDDDNIRLYTPVLQRVIILAAVIIAVPVVMWTITTFVRTYVAPPKAPTFQRLTENAAAAERVRRRAGGRRARSRGPASRAARSAVADGRSAAPPPTRARSLSIKKPAAGDQAAAPDAAAPAAAPQIATARAAAGDPADGCRPGPADRSPRLGRPGPRSPADGAAATVRRNAGRRRQGERRRAGIRSRLCLAQSQHQCAPRPRHG